MKLGLNEFLNHEEFKINPALVCLHYSLLQIASQNAVAVEK